MTIALPTDLIQLEFPELLSYGLNSQTRPLFIYNNPNIIELTFPKTEAISNGFTYDAANEGCFISTCNNLKKIYFPNLRLYGESLPGHGTSNGDYGCLVHSCPELEEVLLPKWTGIRDWRIVRNCPKVWKVVLGDIEQDVTSLYGSKAYPFDNCVKLRHLEFASIKVSLDLRSWAPDSDTLSHQDFLPNFRKYIITRLIKPSSPLTLTLSGAVYQAVYGLDSNYDVDPISTAQTATLGDLGVTEEDLNDIEISAGITTSTIYATWLDTYRNAINWNIQYA